MRCEWKLTQLCTTFTVHVENVTTLTKCNLHDKRIRIMFLFNHKSHYKNTAGAQEKLKALFEIKYSPSIQLHGRCIKPLENSIMFFYDLLLK